MPEPLSPENKLKNDLRSHVKLLTDKCINDRETSKFNDKIDNMKNRFLAMRSIRGLDYKDLPKTNPWPGCSDIGIPIEAITIQSIVARCDRVEFERLPLTHVTPIGQADIARAPKIEAYLDWQKLNRMQIRIPKLIATREALTVGSHFWKMIYEEDYIYDDEEIMALKDPDTNEYLKDDTGEIYEYNSDEPIPLNESGHPYELVITETPRKKLYYRGPWMYGRSPKQILWDSSETSYDPNEWDWWADTYERTVEWLDTKGREIGYENPAIEAIIAKMNAVARNAGQDSLDRKKLVKLREWYGEYLVNGKMRSLVVVIAPEYNEILGWQFDKFRQRTGMNRLVHRCPIPMEGQVIGLSIPQFIKGLRDCIDTIINQMNDRGSRYNNPPIIYAHGSGFDPRKHNFGYRFWPEKVAGTLRELPMQRGESNEFAKMELLLSLVQRLFGVTDTTSGLENPQNQTYGGITTLLAEGNVNIDMLIQTLNESNIQLDQLIIAMNALYMQEDEEGNPIPQEFPILDSYSAVMEDPDNPFITITQDELLGKYNYIPAGASLTVNTRSLREEAGYLYKTAIESTQMNPFIDLEVLREATADLYKSFGKKNIKIKSVGEMNQILAQKQAEAMQVEAMTQGANRGRKR